LWHEVRRLNVVCLSGQVARAQQEIALSLPVGWRSVVLDVDREGDDSPGVLPVVLALPPAVVGPTGSTALWPGRPILVIGKLQVDVDHGPEPPIAYHSVVAHRIEIMPPEGGPFASLAVGRVF
jgi:hypothetical protein